MTLTRTISNLALAATPINGADVTIPDNELLQHINDLINGAASAEQYRFDAISTPGTPSSGKFKLYFKTAGLHMLNSAGEESVIGASHVCEGRLTLTSGLSVTTSDVTAATSVYFTPHVGNRIAIYNGSSWAEFAFSELTLSLSGLAANTNFDVFIYNNSGTLTLESVAWTTDTARATGLTRQDGVRVKSGETNKRYIGTIRTTGTIGQCEDSISKRYVWNAYNRVARNLQVTDTTDSWTYATATWRGWNNAAANRVGFVRGLNEDNVIFDFVGALSTSTPAGAVGIGLDSTSSPSIIYSRAATTAVGPVNAGYKGTPSEGFHFLQLLEYAVGATVTFYGDNGTTFMQTGGTGSVAA